MTKLIQQIAPPAQDTDSLDCIAPAQTIPAKRLGLAGDLLTAAQIYDESQRENQIREAAHDLLEACKSSLRVFQGWLHDADPHNELGTGDSADRDAAVTMIKLVSATIKKAEGSTLSTKGS